MSAPIESTGPTVANRVIAQAETRGRIGAFTVTALAVFVMACLIWPLTANQFRSVSSISIAGPGIDSIEQLEKLLARAVKQEVTPEQLESLISAIESKGKINSKAMEFRDHTSLQESIKLGVRQSGSGFELQLVFDGEGRAEERALINLLAKRVAGRLIAENQTTIRGPLESIDQATWIVSQIENDLEQLKTSVSQLGLNSGDRPTLASDTTDQRFQLASTAKVVGMAVDDLENSIASIDIKSLRSVMGQLKSQLAVSSDPSTAGTPSNTTHAMLTIGSMTPSKSRPIGGVPGWGSLLFLGALSGMIGVAVAWHYQPFASRGFEGAAAIGKKLGIPIVATISSSVNSASESDTSTRGHVSWANGIVKIAGLALFGIAIVVVGFVFLNPEVREAFFENPLFGCSKIVRMFFGY